MVVEKGNCIRHSDVARGGVVQVIEEDADLGVFKICQQINDPVDGGTRPLVAFGRHRGGDVKGDGREQDRGGKNGWTNAMNVRVIGPGVAVVLLCWGQGGKRADQLLAILQDLPADQ
jgi:hypothetical protein